MKNKHKILWFLGGTFSGIIVSFCVLWGIAALFSNAVSSTNTLSMATSPNLQYVAKAQFADGGGFGSGPYTVKVTDKKALLPFFNTKTVYSISDTESSSTWENIKLKWLDNTYLKIGNKTIDVTNTKSYQKYLN